MKQQRNSYLSPKVAGMALALFGLGSLLGGAGEAQAGTKAIIDGVIDRITVDNPIDPWSGGTIEVGGQRVIIPKNLLMDLPANRMTLVEFMKQAPGLCPALGQSGLARADSPFCNTSGQPGYALIHANRTDGGNIIAGDVFISKGLDAVEGTVTFIDYNNGYLRLNGNLADPTTGVMVRLNDPGSRHTIQFGPGCVAGQKNCSPDPRFTADLDNYTNVFATGYPVCIPSTVGRASNVPGLLLGGVAPVGGATPAGTGDQLCPDTNRTVNAGNPVNDSRFFAPIMVGDNMTAEGNFERINGQRFLSAHTTMVQAALTTKALADQPDYFFLDEVFIDAPAFQNERIRMLIIGFATLSDLNPLLTGSSEDVLFWSVHYDPTNNAPHELPLASIVGCETADGAGSCSNQGLAGIVGPAFNIAGKNIFRIRYDVDFRVGAKTGLNPCAQLLAEPRFASAGNVCPNGFGVFKNPPPSDLMGPLSPIPHEIMARTGKKFADVLALGAPNIVKTMDVSGNEASWGQYLFPFGMGLGGIDLPNFAEIDIAKIQTPLSFSGIPWNLDRRLSPGGCLRNGAGVAQCEPNAQPLTPFPYEGTFLGLPMNPRTQAVLMPTTAYPVSAYNTVALANPADRILSYVDTAGKSNGLATVLAWPPVNPAATLITPVIDVPATNLPPRITSLPVLTAKAGFLYSYQVVVTDDVAPLNVIYTLDGSPPAGMAISATGLITWTPTQAQAPAQGLTITVTDAGGLYDKQGFVISVNGAPSFVNVPAPATAKVGVQYAYQPFATDPNLPSDTLTYTLVAGPTGTAPLGATTFNPATGRFTWIPTVGQVGARSFSIRVTDALGASQLRTFNATVAP